MPLFRRKTRAPENTTEDFAPVGYQPSAYVPSLYGATWANQTVTEWSANSLPAFWRGLNLLCDHVAKTPFHAYRSRERMASQPSLLTEPTPGETAYDVFFQLTWSLVLRGNAYAYLYDFSTLGYPRSLLVLNPDLVTVHVNSDGEVEYRLQGQLIPATEILHIRGPRPAGSVVGVGVLAAQAQALAHGISLNEFSARYFGDAAVPSGVIKVPGQLSEEDAKQLQKDWANVHGAGHRKTAVLPSGMEFQPITATPEDQQLLEARKFSLMEIALMLGIPPRWLGAPSDAFTYANLEAENASLVQFGLSPWTNRIEAALTTLLPRPQYVKANFDALLRSDTKGRYEAYRLANPEARWLTEDEIRELEDRPPLPEDTTPPPTEVTPNDNQA